MSALYKTKSTLFLLVAAVAAVFFIFSGAVILSSTVKSQDNTPAIPDSTVIQLPNQQVSRIENAADEAGLEIERKLTLPDNKTLVTLKGSPGAVKLALGSGPHAPLSFMETKKLETFPNYTYKPAKSPNDPKYSDQWNMDKVEAPKAWGITTGSTDTVIAIVDGGVLFSQDPYHDHSDMKDTQRWVNSGETENNDDSDNNGYDDDLYGWDFTGGYAGSDDCPNSSQASEDNDPQPYSCDNENDKGLLNKNHYNGSCDPNVGSGGACYIGHGTVVGSIAAAKTNNSTLVAGTDWNAKIMNLRVFDGYGRATTDRVVAAVKYAADNSADAINLSLAVYNSNGSCDITDTALENALKKARDNNVISAAASGNGNASHVCYPASSKHTIAVGASTVDDKRASFSNYGNRLDLIAPGKDTPALTAPSKANGNGEYVGNADGTSLSTPHVTGAAALLKGQFPNATLNDLRANLRDTATNVKQMQGKDYTKKHGDGRLNIYHSLQVANIIHPDGMLVRPPGGDKVYQIEDEGSAKRHIASREIFQSYGFDFTFVRKTTPTDSNITEGSSIDFREGTLVQGDTDPVYVINYDSNGNIEKRHIVSRSAFDYLGYSFDDVLSVTDSQLPSTDGEDIE